MSFDNKIQQWIHVDNQLKRMNEQVKLLREQRNSLEQNITTYAKTNNMMDTTVQFSTDKLKFIESKIQEPLTFKYLERSLKEIIKNDNQIQMIINHLKQNRNSKSVLEIRRY